MEKLGRSDYGSGTEAVCQVPNRNALVGNSEKRDHFVGLDSYEVVFLAIMKDFTLNQSLPLKDSALYIQYNRRGCR